MSDAQFDLRAEPWITVTEENGAEPRDLSLPAVLGSLATDNAIVSFQHLQAHQAQAWYCFLCQVAAMALHRAGLAEPVSEGRQWAELLLELADGQDTAWCLVVEDLAEPAFFQPPVPEGQWAALDKTVEHPDDLDLLVTSMNHDVKIARIARPLAAHWAFALVSLQTTANFGGRGNYGVARKSSGYSCRPFVGRAPGTSWGERFRRDVPLLVSQRDRIAGRYGYARSSGLALTFLRPWDGTDSIPLEELEPYFVEDCRRVRLRREDGAVRAQRAATKTRRVAAKPLEGNVGDPWTPIRVSQGTALNVSGAGFRYELVADLLLTGEYELGVAADAGLAQADDRVLILRALSRGQGQTNGLHERTVPLPRRIRRRLREPEDREELGDRARERVGTVSTVQKRALRPALCALFQGDPPDLDFRDERVRPWLQRLDNVVDRVFFARLWEDAELSFEDAQARWTEEVLGMAADVLSQAIDCGPVPELRQYRGWAGAERIFQRARRDLLGKKTSDTKREEQRT